MSSITLTEGSFADLDIMQTDQACGMAEHLPEGVFDIVRTARNGSLRVNGYVGTLFFGDGTHLNAVPSTRTVMKEGSSDRVFMEMLYSVFGISTETVMTENLFEFLVRIFADSVNVLVNRGLRSKYHLVSGNEKAFKGRIVFNEHIRQNYIHKERIFVEYEYYSQNRPENRLIKAALEMISRRSVDHHNAKILKNLISHMEEIPASTDVDKDLSMVVIDRNMVDYIVPMFWCRLFLKGLGLAGASRENIPYALLIRTDSLFDTYVAKMAASEHDDGIFRLKYDADIRGGEGSGDPSVIEVTLGWTYYDRVNDRSIDHAESLYMMTPGYRVLPSYGSDRLRTMAESYLADALM